ncbi:matrix protein import protein [Mitosporidium daphniae]|uniref:Phosphatidate cytidylyltransferase, mitochondrial n=1 Tax=Mitosporidium daphniae TaxID=1485682 RepID=A0A098VWA9_9MICR|nr:matrix protein import protein [Mitosporidium daphniae]KGG53169.1 matrix protein import protein [Mitosporidium daphniae]|eukprot:XP_013239605.1 matrix protein import protein [Mitosporidium daphniae]
MDITSAFNAPILAAFAYGSAINTAENDSSVQTDYILIVEDTKAFHSLTKRQYPCHYSAIMKALPPRYLSYLNDTIPAGLFFHPYVSFDNDVFGHNVKYGVISLASALDDLKNWKFLYLAGRLQKPVKWIRPVTHFPHLCCAIEDNLLSALSASLLILGQKKKECSLFDLFTKIVSLSYFGDVRMKFAEDPRKILKIITMEPFNGHSPFSPICAMEELYLPLIKKVGEIEIFQDSCTAKGFKTDVATQLRSKTISFPKSDEYRRYLSSYLPRSFEANRSDYINSPDKLASCKQIDL